MARQNRYRAKSASSDQYITGYDKNGSTINILVADLINLLDNDLDVMLGNMGYFIVDSEYDRDELPLTIRKKGVQVAIDGIVRKFISDDIEAWGTSSSWIKTDIILEEPFKFTVDAGEAAAGDTIIANNSNTVLDILKAAWSAYQLPVVTAVSGFTDAYTSAIGTYEVGEAVNLVSTTLAWTKDSNEESSANYEIDYVPLASASSTYINYSSGISSSALIQTAINDKTIFGDVPSSFNAVRGRISYDSGDGESGNTGYKYKGIAFQYKMFYLTSELSSDMTSSIARAGSSKFGTSRYGDVTVNSASEEYIWIMYPTDWHPGSFKVNGFVGGFNSPETIDITLPNGSQESYYAYRTENPLVGTTIVTIL